MSKNKHIKLFEDYVSEWHQTQTYMSPMLGGIPNDHSHFENPSFKVQLHSVDDNRRSVEPGMSGRRGEAPLKKGDWVEVKSRRNGLEHLGKFISGKQDKKGNWIEMTIIDCHNDLRVLEPAEIKRSSLPRDKECHIKEGEVPIRC